MTLRRCDWPTGSPLLLTYHDTEWGVPLYDDRKLFEFLILEGMQAGLSWLTVLRKREQFRRAFDQFDPHRIARYRSAKIRQLLGDAGIIRNRQKIEAAVNNARAFLEVQAAYGSFQRLMWDMVGGRPIVNRRRRLRDLPARTPESDAMSDTLRRLGFRFVGSTICYAHMQATGMVNDHLVSCYRYHEVMKLAAPLRKRHASSAPSRTAS
ncbi:MAG: DNA-3-methyladenine glycosylase I [Candidatus Omnitrophica bacterium CG11_big_fil_rev_8_21_14_0_20_63_9]|nr:MAG: DNA-3-methyladenine glycosylase I [Candidatus Omnitrophica bacterium CG11_big_fil_rev_8_21_14_0_20_63_9]